MISPKIELQIFAKKYENYQFWIIKVELFKISKPDSIEVESLLSDQ